MSAVSCYLPYQVLAKPSSPLLSSPPQLLTRGPDVPCGGTADPRAQQNSRSSTEPSPVPAPRLVASLQRSASPCGGFRGHGGVALTPPTSKKPPSVPRAAGRSRLATGCHGTPHRRGRKARDATRVVSPSCLAKSHSDTALGTESDSAIPRRSGTEHGACPTVHSQSDTQLGGGGAVAKGNQSDEVERPSSARRHWGSESSVVSW